jgi:histidyl-tRNA synthetase
MKPPRGMHDLPPQEAAKLNLAIQEFRAVFQSYGFLPLETPCVESFELLAAKGGLGEGVRDEIYCFKDKAGRELGLRFDLTMSLARFVITNPNLPKPFKRWQIGRAWRYDEPQRGRYREFWQADIDIVGAPPPLADAECCAVAADCLKAIGITNFTIRVNNRPLLEEILLSHDVSASALLDAFRIIDKLGKFPEETIKAELKQRNIDPSVLDSLLVEGKNESILQRLQKYPSSSELRSFCDVAKKFGISDHIRIDPALARGLDYYTGLVFEIAIGNERLSCGGGGRYDNLISALGGQSTPATGISLGLSRLLDFIQEPKSKLILVAPVSEELREKALEICQKLRSQRIPCVVDLLGRSFSKQLDYANNQKIPYVLIIGQRELGAGRVKLRDMIGRSEREIPLEKIEDELKKL